MIEILTCSDCFTDERLKLDAAHLGTDERSACPNCGSISGRKLDRNRTAELAHRLFVWGSLHRCEFGAAPVLAFNQQQPTSIESLPWCDSDLRLFERLLGIGVFYYGPRMWMVGEVEPLLALQDASRRRPVIDAILRDFPCVTLVTGESFYRLRKSPSNPASPDEYDSPPNPGKGRLDSAGFPVMYASQDLQVCIHECGAGVGDDAYVATLAAERALRLLDLTELIYQEGTSEFESLDIAIHMLFIAGGHSYPISRAVAAEACRAGYDGLVYPSYYSQLRTGAMPFETSFGISHRLVPKLKEQEKAKIIMNLALFGRPITEKLVRVDCINRVILTRVHYDVHFGPVGV